VSISVTVDYVKVFTFIKDSNEYRRMPDVILWNWNIGCIGL